LHGGPGLALFARAAVAVASTIPVSSPVTIPVTVAIAILAHGALIAGYLVEVVVLFEEV
jgi:acyl-CoA hydrolase